MTLNPFTVRDLKRLERWRFILRVVSKERKLDPFEFGGLMLRESGGGVFLVPKNDPCGWGDEGNAFGLFQIDKRYHRQFVESPGAQWPITQARYAADLLVQNRAVLKRHFPGIGDTRLREGMFCAYNASMRRVREAIERQSNPNLVTTGQNYADWIIKKADKLRKAAPLFFEPVTGELT